MEYQLAKELKDAGFPMIKWWKPLPKSMASGEIFILEGGYVSLLVEDNENPFKGENMAWILPTLSELIEACGDEGVFTLDWRKGRNTWEVLVHRNGTDYESSGSTPEEVVARLWLALNKP